jgi:hypothetical protein
MYIVSLENIGDFENKDRGHLQASSTYKIFAFVDDLKD